MALNQVYRLQFANISCNEPTKAKNNGIQDIMHYATLKLLHQRLPRSQKYNASLSFVLCNALFDVKLDEKDCKMSQNGGRPMET